jgi:hypothetical protein
VLTVVIASTSAVVLLRIAGRAFLRVIFPYLAVVLFVQIDDLSNIRVHLCGHRQAVTAVTLVAVAHIHQRSLPQILVVKATFEVALCEEALRTGRRVHKEPSFDVFAIRLRDQSFDHMEFRSDIA